MIKNLVVVSDVECREVSDNFKGIASEYFFITTKNTE